MSTQTGDDSLERPDHVSMKELRAAIPPECFQSSTIRSLFYLSRDLILISIVLVLAVQWADRVPTTFGVVFAWLLYGAVQGVFFTGLWVLGHECGHGAFANSQMLNDIAGFCIHSFLLTPYFSWQSTHRRHHRYTGHIEKDHNHVPLREAEYRSSFISTLEEYGEDTPIYVLGRLILQQLLGWQLYLLRGVTSGPKCYARQLSGAPLERNHFNPYAALFRPSEFSGVVLSDLGIVLAIASLVYIGHCVGWWQLFLLYGQPFLWLNQAIVTLTFLQHTDPSVPRYEDADWTFTKGATSTIDRDLGFVGRELLHNVANCHVVHHLFPRIPFYHAQRATEAIKPLLGQNYLGTDENFFTSLWTVYSQCQWVTSGPVGTKESKSLRFRAGRIPPLGISSLCNAWLGR